MKIEDAIRSAVISEIQASLGSAFSDIGDVVRRHPEIGGLTLSELFAGKAISRGKGKAGGDADTRTATGRDAYRGAVLGVLKSAKRPVSAQFIREQVGGSSLQARAALNWLIEDGQATYEGKARATKYEAT